MSSTSLSSSPSGLGRLQHVFKQLWAQILLALVLGIGLGLTLSPQSGGWLNQAQAQEFATWVRLPGSLFLALIQMVVIPLVMSSIVLGINSAGSPEYLKRIGLRIFPYFVMTTCVAVTLGAILVLWLEPGKYIDTSLIQNLSNTATQTSNAEPLSIPERLVGLIPQNFTRAALDQSMLQLVIYAFMLGIALMTLARPKAKLMLQVFDSIQSIAMKIVSWAMRLAPLAVFGLICDITIQIGLDALLAMSAYVATVLLGLLLLLVFYLVLLSLFSQQSPLHFINQVRSVQLLAFSTSSSAAVMPLSLTTAREKLGIKPGVAQFVIPLGATINMDGTALYQTIAAVFLLQVFGIEISYAALGLLMLTTVGASIGAPSTPGVGIVILAGVLESLGVPGAGVALILGVDRILDMSRTALNVTGDLTACSIMNRVLPEAQGEQGVQIWDNGMG